MLPSQSVSVVIPAYNEAEYIGPCLDALAKQSHPPQEIIVVDNNSSDDTTKIAQAHKGVRVIKEKQQGIVHARNAGFNASKSSIIARIDADTIVPPTWIEHLTKTFHESQSDAVTGPVYFYDLPKSLRHLKTSLGAGHRLVYFGGSKAMLGHEVLFGSNMAITKAIWDKVQSEACLDESSMHEDTDLAVHIAHAGGKIKFDPKLKVGVAARLRADTIQSKSTLPELVSYVSRWTKTGLKHPPLKSKAKDEAER